MRKRDLVRLVASATVLFVLRAGVAVGQSSEGIDGKTALTMLKNLAGEWQGTTTTKDGPPTASRFQVTAAGSTLMETMFPGTDHEMINMYHMNGADLVLKHYCAAGNQPEMKLDPGQSDARTLVFVFTGGTNLDPERDTHIRGAKIAIVDEDHIQSEWTSYGGGKEAGKEVMILGRRKGQK